MSTYIVIIPARLKSSRLPGKPLVDILGKSMIQRTYERALEAVPADKLFVATDSKEIANHLDTLGYNYIMTSDTCLTGTDRIAEVARSIEADYYINVQGDEPLVNPQDIKLIIDKVTQHVPGTPAPILNGYAPILTEEDYHSVTIPKVVVRPDGRLLYMSRAPIPGNKKMEFRQAWRQICIYAFPKQALMAFNKNGGKTLLESYEDIEILRFLEMGYEVEMLEMSTDSIAVDVPEDVEKVINKLKSLGQA